MTTAEPSQFELLPTPVPIKGRIPSDWYPTPRANIEQVLDRLEPGWLGGQTVFDPTAGDGAILEVAAARGALTNGIEIVALLADICRRNGHDVLTGDSLQLEWPAADLLLGNPPFSLAIEFALKAVEWAIRHRARAVLLLRLAFLETQDRFDFHKQYPSDVIVLSQRPSFRADRPGATDTAAYAWFSWGPGCGGRWSVLPPVAPGRGRRKK